MGTAPLGLKLTRRIARDVGEPIKRAVGTGSYYFGFVTFDHRHGVWSKRDGSVRWDASPLHWVSCRWNFDGDLLPEHLCGTRTVCELTGFDLLCDEVTDHEGRHRCGSQVWT